MHTNPPGLRREPLWAITSYYPFDDPPGIKRRLKAYREFRRRLRVPLVAVELSLDNTFDLEARDADVLIQVRGGAVLWQKECLLNLALRHLPDNCDTVAWLDCDIVFERDDWAIAARRTMEEYALVQLFRRVHHLPRDGKPGETSPAKVLDSLASRLVSGSSASMLCSTSTVGLGCTPGVAWMARRETLEEHKFYDAMILGSGDKVTFCAACGGYQEAALAFRLSPRHSEHYQNWARLFSETVQGSLGYLDGDIFHLWHGDLVSRFYQNRYSGFEEFQFDPVTDIGWNGDGVWRWNSTKPALHAFVRRYFERRQGGNDV